MKSWEEAYKERANSKPSPFDWSSHVSVGFKAGWEAREAEIPKAAEGHREAWLFWVARITKSLNGYSRRETFQAGWEAAMAAVWQKLEAGPAEEQGAGQPGEEQVTVPVSALRAVLDQEPRDREGLLRCDSCGQPGTNHDVADGWKSYYIDHAQGCPRLRLRRALEQPGFEHQAPEIRHVVHEEPRTGGGTTVYHLEQKALDKIREELDIDGLAEAVQSLKIRIESQGRGDLDREQELTLAGVAIRDHGRRLLKLEEAAGHHDALRDRVAGLEERIDRVSRQDGTRLDVHLRELEKLQIAITGLESMRVRPLEGSLGLVQERLGKMERRLEALERAPAVEADV